MQNQDPLNPMDNAEVTSQIAQINTVKGIEQLNSTMASVLSYYNAGQSMQATALVGHVVFAPGSVMSLSNGEAQAGASLSQSVDSLTVTVKDSKGNVMQTVNLGPQNAGLVRFSWDGTMDSGGTAADGDYQFSLSAQAKGQKVTPDALSLGQVISVTPSDKGASLSLNGLGDFDFSQIKQIF